MNTFYTRQELLFLSLLVLMTLTSLLSSQISISKSQNIETQSGSVAINQLSFSDTNLAQCIKQSAVAAKKVNVKEITHLHCSAKGIKSAEGISQLTALKELDLSNNPLDINTLTKDSKPLGDTLKRLDLSNTKIKNHLIYNPLLKRLPELTELDLSNNDLSGVRFLNELKQLKRLDLSNNPSLKFVNLRNNKESLRQLNLSNTNVSNFSYIKFLDELTDLDISNNELNADFIEQLSHSRMASHLTRLKQQPGK